jgi:sugar phosphate isomerase/epimerase
MFRIGTTSYIIPDDILPNVEYLAPMVDDVELVLFESDESGSNLPDDATIMRLIELGTAHNLTYTVHLPLDLRMGDGGEATHISLRKAQRVIEATARLDPYAYVLHLDGRALLGPPDVQALGLWQENAARALEVLYSRMERPDRLCVENLEAWDPDAFAPIVSAHPVGRTIDVGHFWLQGANPMEHLERWLDRARVIHIHGIAARDHASLAHVPPAALDPVIDLLARRFTGVVTVEVFNQEDLLSSLDAMRGSLERAGIGNVRWS